MENPEPRIPGALPRRLAQLVVAVAGASILIIETLAARLVAPYVGLTLESNTAAIGVALAGIAAGAALGGRLADQYPPRRVVTTGLLAAAALVLLVRPIVHLAGPHVPPGALSTVVLIAASTFLPVLVLSMVAPAVVKARIADTEHAGRLVGGLSAVGTLGSLAGTFLTGFVFVATLPLGTVLLVTALTCGALGVATLQTRRRNLAAAAAVAALVGTGGAVLQGIDDPCEVETTYYCASIEEDPTREGGRTLLLDELRHSYVDLDDPTHLEFSYTQRAAAAIDTAFPAGEAIDGVYLGGGGFTLPRYTAQTRPGSTAVVLEIDRGVIALAQAELDVDEIEGLTIRPGDARTTLEGLPTDSADVIVGDAFGSLSAPWHLATREFLEEVDRVLRPDGIYVLNLIDAGELRWLAAEHTTLEKALGPTGMLQGEWQKTTAGGNYVLVTSDQPLDWEEMAAAAERHDTVGWGAVTGLDPDETRRQYGGGVLLTDEYAPVDQLLTTTR